MSTVTELTVTTTPQMICVTEGETDTVPHQLVRIINADPDTDIFFSVDDPDVTAETGAKLMAGLGNMETPVMGGECIFLVAASSATPVYVLTDVLQAPA